jgi:hypothetical protein
LYTLKETRSAIIQDESNEKLVIFRSNDCVFSYDFAEFQYIFPEFFTDGLHGPKYPRRSELQPAHWLLNVLKGPMGPALENSRSFIAVYFDLLVRNKTSRNMYRTIVYKPDAPLKIAQISLNTIEEYEKFEYDNMDRLVKNLPPYPIPNHLKAVYQSIEVVHKSLQNYPGSNSEMKDFREKVSLGLYI